MLILSEDKTQIQNIMKKEDEMKLTKEQQEFIEAFLSETGFEIWNGGCTHRMRTMVFDEGVAVCEYHDPLHPIKEYKSVQAAVNFMLKIDEE